MNFDRLKQVRDKTYSEANFYYDALTELGGSLYAYMIMLKLADRNQEARILETARTDIFAARDAGFPECPRHLLGPLLRACWGIDNQYSFLKAVKPDEATVLSSPANNALWVANIAATQLDNPKP